MAGEYLWDHRNGTMLREFLINEFILNDKTGLGNKAVSGFFFDDGWTDKPVCVSLRLSLSLYLSVYLYVCL